LAETVASGRGGASATARAGAGLLPPPPSTPPLSPAEEGGGDALARAARAETERRLGAKRRGCETTKMHDDEDEDAVAEEDVAGRMNGVWSGASALWKAEATMELSGGRFLLEALWGAREGQGASRGEIRGREGQNLGFFFFELSCEAERKEARKENSQRKPHLLSYFSLSRFPPPLTLAFPTRTSSRSRPCRAASLCDCCTSKQPGAATGGSKATREKEPS
jgi:hypothetical protein